MSREQRALAEEEMVRHLFAQVAPARRERLERMLSTVRQHFDGRLHWTGSTHCAHSLRVLTHLLQFSPDPFFIEAAILHSFYSDPASSPQQLKERWGAEVHSIVTGAFLLSRVATGDSRMTYTHLRDVLLRATADVRSILLFLCHQLDVLEHRVSLSKQDWRQVCANALYLYAPVSARLGIYKFKHAFEEYAFRTLYPIDSVRIEEQLKQLSNVYGNFLPTAVSALEGQCRTAGVPIRIEARAKHPYSIFCKLRQKGISSIIGLHDLFALRVVTDAVPDCYQVLGCVHRMGYPLTGRFKDYIAFPKPNGYQSLHTTVLRFPGMPEDLFLEVQIRTQTMHQEANLGLAAHWSYKEGDPLSHRRRQLQKVLTAMAAGEAGHRPGDAIYVLTPRGDAIELPEDATPLDFAFAIHTTLGLSYRGARVNGVAVPMDHALQNGDVVEILRHAVPHPNLRWLAFLKSASARSRLRHALDQLRREEYLAEGRAILNRELKHLHRPLLDTDLSLLLRYGGRRLNRQAREDVLVELGSGRVRLTALLQNLLDLAPPPVEPHSRPHAHSVRVLHPVPAERGMPTTYAGCCKPSAAPGEPIVGVIRGAEVRVHRHTCRFLANVNPERIVAVTWEEPVKKKSRSRQHASRKKR